MNALVYQRQSTDLPGCADHEDAGARATRDDAPFPDEHVETDRPGTVPSAVDPRDVDDPLPHAESALNLRSRQIGGPGGWHGSLWWCPVEGVPWDVHFALTSDRGPNAERNGQFAEWLGETELADARQALGQYRHPAAKRCEAIHCTTHVRAIVEKAWAKLPNAGPPKGAKHLLEVLDPTTIARWVRAEADRLRLHALAKRVRDEL